MAQEVPFSLDNVPKSKDFYAEDPETQTIFFESQQTAKANETLAVQTEEEKRLHRHGVKIINSLLTGEQVATSPETPVQDNAYEIFYNWINDGQLTSAHESQLLQTIAPPLSSRNSTPEKLLAQLASDHEHGILAYASGRGFHYRKQVNTSHLQAVISRYPTPVEFADFEETFLSDLRSTSGEAKATEYQSDLEVFKNKFYGKRQQYHKAWQQLERQAKDYQTLHAEPVESPEERAQKIKDGIYAEYFYPEEDLGYQAPEQRERWRNPDYVAPENQTTQEPAPSSKQRGIFNKLFNRKK